MLSILDDAGSDDAGAPADATFALTERAAKKVGELLADENKTRPVRALRVGVRGGGCSGFQYFMEFTDATEPGDRVFEAYGVAYYIDERSLTVLNGGGLDYSSGLRESGFKWLNPNQKKTCGCGESFSV